MKIEIGKKYKGLINGCVFKVVGLSKLSAWDVERNRDIYFDIKILEPSKAEIKKLSHSQSFLKHLQIEEIN